MTMTFLLVHDNLDSEQIATTLQALGQLLRKGHAVRCSASTSNTAQTLIEFHSSVPLSNTQHKRVVELEAALRTSKSTVGLWVGQRYSASLAGSLAQLEANLNRTPAPWIIRWLEPATQAALIHLRSAEFTELIHDIRAALGWDCPAVAEGWTGDRRVLVVTSAQAFADESQADATLKEVVRQFSAVTGSEIAAR